MTKANYPISYENLPLELYRSLYAELQHMSIKSGGEIIVRDGLHFMTFGKDRSHDVRADPSRRAFGLTDKVKIDVSDFIQHLIEVNKINRAEEAGSRHNEK